jgi:hypothetical protein
VWCGGVVVGVEVEKKRMRVGVFFLSGASFWGSELFGGGRDDSSLSLSFSLDRPHLDVFDDLAAEALGLLFFVFFVVKGGKVG